MSATVSPQFSGCQSSSGDSADMSRARTCLRQAIEECHYTHDALAAAMGCSASLVTRILNGERPLREDWICQLPDDVEARYLQKRAEALGVICVEPLHGLDARKALVSGLMGLMGDALLAAVPVHPAVALKGRG